MPLWAFNFNLLNKGDKMTKNQLSIFNQLRPLSIGFDNVFDHFESMLNDDFGLRVPTVNYPPYNIVKTGDYTYDIELALAGFNKKDIEVEYADNLLTIKSVKSEEAKAQTWCHSQRYL